jgi:hypothetical protein
VDAYSTTFRDGLLKQAGFRELGALNHEGHDSD